MKAAPPEGDGTDHEQSPTDGTLTGATPGSAMPAQRLPMRQVREVLRLKHAAGFSERRIATAIGISRTTVAEYLRRAAVFGITWPVPDKLDDAALERRLFSPPFAVQDSPRPQPDWPRLHAELRRPGVQRNE